MSLSSLRRIGVVTTGLLTATVLFALVVLPRVARDRLDDRLAELGPVRSVEVDGLSGLGALRGRPTALAVHLERLDPDAARDGGGRLAEVPSLDLRADAVAAGPLTLSGLQLRKRDTRVRATADAAPGGAGPAQLVAVDGAPALRIVLPPAAALLGGGGAATTIPLVVRDGAIYADTSALPVGGGGEQQVFASADVAVDELTARDTGSGVRVAAAAHTTPG